MAAPRRVRCADRLSPEKCKAGLTGPPFTPSPLSRQVETSRTLKIPALPAGADGMDLAGLVGLQVKTQAAVEKPVCVCNPFAFHTGTMLVAVSRLFVSMRKLPSCMSSPALASAHRSRVGVPTDIQIEFGPLDWPPSSRANGCGSKKPAGWIAGIRGRCPWKIVRSATRLGFLCTLSGGNSSCAEDYRYCYVRCVC